MVKILNKENTILNKFLAQMRDKKVQGEIKSEVQYV